MSASFIYCARGGQVVIPFKGLRRAAVRAGIHAPWRQALGDRPVRRHVQGVDLWLPWSHRLPDYARLEPAYGQNLVEFARLLGRDGPIQILDVGANVGDSALQICAATPCRVLAIEPDPAYLHYLELNVGSRSDVTIAPFLLTVEQDQRPRPVHQDVSTADARWVPSRGGGTTHFVREDIAAGSSRQGPAVLSVEELSDAFPDFSAVNLIKSDTDGYDTMLVPALARVQAASRPALFFEYDPRLTASVAAGEASDVWPTLADLGYESVAVWDNVGEPLCMVGIEAASGAIRDVLRVVDAPPYVDVAVVHCEDERGISAMNALAGSWNRPAHGSTKSALPHVEESTPVSHVPALSFLVPSYNPGPYLIPAIESIVDQLVEGDEVLLQDGGSTDGSIEETVAHFGSPDWLKVVSEPDRGQSDALQKALDRAVNEYVVWLNADDVVYPGALAKVRAGLHEHNPDLLIGRSTIFNNDGRIVRTYTPRPFSRRALVGRGADLFTGSMIYRGQVIRDAGGFEAKYQYCMDMDMIARTSEMELDIVYIPDVIGGLRWHEESKGGSTLWPIVKEATEVRLAHARGPKEQAIALGSSGVYLVAGMMQPLRHSRAYSATRDAFLKRGRRRAPGQS